MKFKKIVCPFFLLMMIALLISSCSGCGNGSGLISGIIDSKRASRQTSSINTAYTPTAEETRIRSNTVGISQGSSDYAVATRMAIEAAGGLNDIIHKDDVVLIKPNVCLGVAEAGSQTITDYRAVQEVVNMAREAGASKVIIGEGSIIGEPFSKDALFLNKYDKLSGVDKSYLDFGSITDDNQLVSVLPKNSQTGEAFYFPKDYLEVDKVITVAKMKTHSNGVVTLALKNSVGIVPRSKYSSGNNSPRDLLHGIYYNKLSQAIVDLNLIREPDFAVIEGIVAGEGNGPTACSPVDAKVIIAGEDLVAVDTVGLNFMGFTINEVPHVKLAWEAGLGEGELSKIKIIGADLNKIKMKFKRP